MTKEYKYGQFTLRELPADYVGYFGTLGRAGHDLVSLEGYKDIPPYPVLDDWTAFFDGDWLFRELLKSPRRLSMVKVFGLTIVGNPHSLDDERPHSKTLLICGGDRDQQYMAGKIEQHPWVSEIFHKVCDRFCE